jgi:DNA-directed RNA polymerase subunit RPC12/RpoP
MKWGWRVGYSELLAVSSMICPHCQSRRLQKLKRTTDLGYLIFRCGDCGRKSNERTGTPFNFLEFPTDIMFQIVLCRLHYKLSLCNLAEMFLLRGFQFTHGTVRDWEARFAQLLAEQLRRGRKGKVGRRLCRAFEEVRQYFRSRRKRKQFVPLAKQRGQFVFER